MSEQQPRKNKQNIIRFPSSGKERRRLLREHKDPRLRITAAARTICGWLLVIGTFLFLLTNYSLFSPSSLRSLVQYTIAGLHRTDDAITTITYQNGTFSDGALFHSGLAYADSDSLFLARPGGTTDLQYALGYSDPVVETNGDYVLAYDRGGMQAALVNAAGPTAELTLSSPIITGSIGKGGRFVLVTDEQGYHTAVSVYDAHGKEIFKFQSSDYYIVSAGLSPDGKTLAALAFQQNGVSLDSHVQFYDVSNGKLHADAALPNALGIELCYTDNNTAAVLCDDGLYLVNRRGTAEQVLTSASGDLIAFAKQDNALALATRSYAGNARADLYTVRGGTLSGPYALPEEPTALSVSSAGTAVLSASGAAVYDSTFAPRWRNSDAVGARRLLLTGDGTLFALYTKNARIFTARSTNSEDLSHAT